MIPDTKKKRVIEEIINSKEFNTSPSYINLLQYLLENHLKNEIPTESTIAVEYFNKKSTYNSSEDSTVRYHMYKLRKKIELYYSSEGNKDNIVVSIPKGHYEMKFNEIDKNDSKDSVTVHQPIVKHSKREKSYITLASLSFLLAVIFIILWQQAPKIINPISDSDPIWSSVFDNEYPTNLVIGDIFVFEEQEPNSEQFRRIMDYSIHSYNQFLEYKSQYPDRETRDLIVNELPHNSIFNLKDIMHVFYSFNKPFEIKFSHSLNFSDLKNHNNVYIGEFLNLEILCDLINLIPIKTNFFEEQDLRTMTVFSDEMDTLKTFQSYKLYSRNEYNSDYGIIAKLPGLSGEKSLIIAGFGYMAQIELVKMLSQNELLEKLENQIKEHSDEVPDHFCAVFVVSGHKITGYSIELELFKEINENKYLESFRELLTTE